MKPALILSICCWMAASWLGRPIARQPLVSSLAMQGSLWGAMAAEFMRPALHLYWHAGREESVAAGGLRSLLARRTRAEMTTLSQQLRQANTPVPASLALRRHSEAVAASYLQLALRLAPFDWSLLDIAMEAAKTGLQQQPELVWSRLLTLAQPSLSLAGHSDINLAQALSQATVLAHLSEAAQGLGRQDLPQWRQRLQMSLAQCEKQLLAHPLNWQLMSQARQEDLQAHLSLLQRLSASYPKG